ncbi:hypothetical protein [Methylobrevis pamukkalensis]|uniref:Ribbon-helix-helix protein CopG domain-containing protein n=1 Tax=Methylobrevis pamukkalensis TaxID=1439726 RepID=A0A1E3GP62_9HYPH|nr:hypothetical protein [Methylobrevis pamukkalensis]ODN65828.1 hypothetical protein A6302_04490 [Methylobrevis pamukkalensis]
MDQPAGARIIRLTLNDQQLELLDRTVARGVAGDRIELVRRALREQAARHLGEARS